MGEGEDCIWGVSDEREEMERYREEKMGAARTRGRMERETRGGGVGEGEMGEIARRGGEWHRRCA